MYSIQARLRSTIRTLLFLNLARCIAAIRVFCSQQVKDLLVEESNVQPVQAPVTVCGDIHGQFYDLLELFKVGEEVPATSYVFMVSLWDRCLPLDSLACCWILPLAPIISTEHHTTHTKSNLLDARRWRSRRATNFKTNSSATDPNLILRRSVSGPVQEVPNWAMPPRFTDEFSGNICCFGVCRAIS